ncbi:carbohydrate ABC transporter permease [Alteribacter populi]|uniref:carbohydrate ABC transporter permease n=1 Tax=Alteribacter populi TaxID=2011011 RepID=UPI000BBABB09|nr:sugar ABC transporter permease [Alteribacter populi]
MTDTKSRNLFILLCLAPALIMFVLFMVIPTAEIFRMSLYQWGGLSGSQHFIGLDNFRSLWNDMNFIRSVQNSILLIVVVALITIVFALFIASVLVREDTRGSTFFRIVFYIPNILSIVVIAGIFSAIYSPSTGLLNSFLDLLQLEGLQRRWLGNETIVIYSVAAALIWQATGYYMVMYLSSIASIPSSYYEAASLEGISRFKEFTSITLPLIWSTIRTTLTFYIISTVNLSFLLVTAMTGGGPNRSSEVFLSYMYNQAYGNSSYGYGMAIAVVVFIFLFSISAIVSSITKRDVLEY